MRFNGKHNCSSNKERVIYILLYITVIYIFWYALPSLANYFIFLFWQNEHFLMILYLENRRLKSENGRGVSQY